MFIGRAIELSLLRETKPEGHAPLIAVYGRRRVGKTALVEKAFENEIIWKFEGIEGAGTRQQIQHFLFTLRQYSQNPRVQDLDATATWQEALLLLDICIGDRRVVLFFDEFQWMASMRSQLVSLFKWAWDNHFSKKGNCRFVVCGSVSSFIVKKVLRSTALYGRIDLEVCLKPLSIAECSGFFGSARTPGEMLDLYFSLGGIPQYQLEIRANESAIQNLVRLAFSPHGYFTREYQRLFVSHFAKHKVYEHLLKSLATRRTQDSRDLSHSVGLTSGGTFSALLDDLEMAGFIERYVPLDKNSGSKLIQVRLADEFLDFYFTFIDTNRKEIEEGTLKGFELLTGPKFDQWRGYAFERFCRKHSAAISRSLGFSGIKYRSGSWFGDIRGKKIQADLVFDRADGILTVCEMKYVRTVKTDAVSAIERTVSALTDHYGHPIQKVLVLGNGCTLTPAIRQAFDEILYAEKVFFST
jgi:AAA+ ATPase superfamily predicted ATPase